MNNRYVWYVLVGVLVVLLIVGFAGRQESTGPEGTASPTATPASGAAKPKSTGGATSTLSYGDALRLYGSFRMQFDALCQAIPNNMTLKNGQSVMFDNRSGDPRTIRVGSVAYNLAGYGFRVVPMTSRTLPQTLVVDCGGAQNVGQIVIQR